MSKDFRVDDRSYSEGYRFWAEHYPLMDAEEEKQWLTQHQDSFERMVRQLVEQQLDWFKQKYADLDWSQGSPFEVLWQKRPYMRDITYWMQGAYKDDERMNEWWRELREARDHIIASNVRLVMKIAHQHPDDELSFFDLVQEGQFGLMRALDKFDVALGLRFTTYAHYWVVQFIRLAIKKDGRLVRIPTNVQEEVSKAKRHIVQTQQREGTAISHRLLASNEELDSQRLHDYLALMQPVYSLNEARGDEGDLEHLDFLEGEEDPEQDAVVQGDKQFVASVLHQLPSRERMILAMRYGIGHGKEYGYREIAEQLHLSRERVRQIEHTMLAQLHNRFGDPAMFE